MPYGEILGGSFRLIWREKKLWLFGIIGLALGSLGIGIYLALALNWQANVMRLVTDPVFLTPNDPEEVLVAIFGSMQWLFAALGFLACFSVLGYVLNLIVRGAIIAEAGRGWRGERTDLTRGFDRGLRRSPRLFVIDLIWGLLTFVVVGCGLSVAIGGFVGAVGTAVRSQELGGDAGSAILAAIGSMMVMFAAVACIGILIAALRGIFAPLMYQAAVQGEHPFGAAISQGWNLARRNLGPMIVFLLFMAGLQIVVYFLMQLAALPLSGVWMTSYFGMMTGLFEGGAPPPPSAVNSILLIFGGLLYAAANVLLLGFVQALVLTVYARVYQHLNDAGTPISASDSLPALTTDTPAPA